MVATLPETNSEFKPLKIGLNAPIGKVYIVFQASIFIQGGNLPQNGFINLLHLEGKS